MAELSSDELIAKYGGQDLSASGKELLKRLMWEELSAEDRLPLVASEANAEEWFADAAIDTLGHFRSDAQRWGWIRARARNAGVNPWDLQQAVDGYIERHRNGAEPALDDLPRPQTLTELLHEDIPEPVSLLDGLLHEGMVLFGGKSKRGKSWLMFDLAISVATGRHALRHFACPRPAPVLYLALEDGKKRLQTRARMIQANLTTVDNLHLLYTFPPFPDGITQLERYIQRYGFQLVVIDVLAHLEQASKAKGGGEKGYHEVYEMFAPLQALRRQYPFAIVMLTHLRKQEAEEAFDGLHGSVAYQGAQDVLWVLERKPKDNDALLHTSDKDTEDQTLAITFVDGHWEYVGEGEEYELDKERRKILRVLSDESRPMTIVEIMKAAGIPDARYARVRQILMTMVRDDILYRAQRGRYAASMHAIKEWSLDDKDVPFK